MDTAAPLACQRHHFEMPDDVSYLDAAAWSPLPRAVRLAGEAGILSKSLPWLHARDDDTAWAERARTAAATLIGAAADEVGERAGEQRGKISLGLFDEPLLGGGS